jgi:predicted nucleic acid-binding protein
VPEIADYEIRRELIRSERWHGIERLDVLATELGYLPLTTETMRRAAEFWAVARQRGRPTASDAAIDADMILCTQAAIATVDGHQVIIATTNVAHLSLFANAGRWQDIR